jgi:hypothetical protein
MEGVEGKFTAIVYWDELAPTGAGAYMWKKMPKNQLSKCCEAAALRKGFPQELSGLYVEEELERSANEIPDAERAKDRSGINYEKQCEQTKDILNFLRVLTEGMSLNEKGAYMITNCKVNNVKDFLGKTNDELDEVLTTLKQLNGNKSAESQVNTGGL